MKKILFVVPYPYSIAPSQRFRYEQYLEILNNQGFSCQIHSFIDDATWAILHKPGKFVEKALGIVKAFGRRLFLLFKLGAFDYVFIHREASHIGPPIFEWLIAKVFNKRIIYDFDDAIWLPNYSEHNAAFHRLKMYDKVKSTMRWAYKISAGNDYLADFARNFNSSVVVNPTTIDTENYHNPLLFNVLPKPNRPVIGWTGTLTTAKYLDELVPVLQRLEQEYDFEFHIICNQDPKLPVKSAIFKPWKKASEIEDLMLFDIGLMPLADDQWASGKCGFKALQYMALGVPAVVSPVGVNRKIVDHALNGYVCNTSQEWYECLSNFLKDSELRKKMGKEARLKVENYYSVKSNTANFVGLFS